MAAKKTTATSAPVEETKVEVKTAKVNAENGLNFRSNKSLDADVIDVLTYGTEVVIEGKATNGWVKVSVGDKTGFVVAEYLA